MGRVGESTVDLTWVYRMTSRIQIFAVLSSSVILMLYDASCPAGYRACTRTIVSCITCGR